MKKIQVVFFALLSLSVSVAVLGDVRAEERPPKPKVLLAAPQFTLPDIDNNTLSLRDHRGDVILLFFTATWCPYCRKAAPDLNSLYDTYRDKGFVILSIFVEDAQRVKTLAKKISAAYPVLIDNGSVMKTYGVAAIPEFILIDRQGRITKRARVGLTFDVKKEFSIEIEDLL